MPVTINGSSGLTANNGSVFTDGSGNVGIGTGSPANLLHVVTSTAAGSKFEQTSTGANYLTLRSNGSDRAYVGLENSVGTGLFGSGSAFGLSMGTVVSAAVAISTNNTIRMRINADGGIVSQPTGGGTLLEQFGCRAWVNFNGTGTVAIRASGNVSSITDGGTGFYGVNFTNAMPDANYSVTASVIGSSSNWANAIRTNNSSVSSSSVSLNTGFSNADSLQDLPFVHVAIFR
jgi:hypothetical protein